VSIQTQGVQLWTVPFTGTYEITAVGGRGGGWYPSSGTSAYGGGGAYLKGTTTLSSGTVIAIIVGQGGSDMLQNGGAGGGGGASWVLSGGAWTSGSASAVYAIAGGGGGASAPIHVTGAYGGSGGTSQGNVNDSAGGNNGNYGNGGGAGFSSDGQGINYVEGLSPYNGSPLGGDHTGGGGATGYSVRFPVDGGFGGGGASSWHLAGGGGGYAGGDGADWTPPDGMGGTSYHNLTGVSWGTSSHNYPYGGSNNHGYVTIKAVVTTSVPSRFVIWGVNEDSDNDTQVLAAYSGTLASGNGKGDYWRGNNPPDLYWSYWGNDWHSSSPGQTISVGRQTDPGIPTGITSSLSLHTGDVYLIAYGPPSVAPPLTHSTPGGGADYFSGQSFTITGSQAEHTFTVTAGTTVRFQLYGGAGGRGRHNYANTGNNGLGGPGGYVSVDLAFSSDMTIYAYVGQGHDAISVNECAGPGGGSTDIRSSKASDSSGSVTNSTFFSNFYSGMNSVLAVAGGGGGGHGGSFGEWGNTGGSGSNGPGSGGPSRTNTNSYYSSMPSGTNTGASTSAGGVNHGNWTDNFRANGVFGGAGTTGASSAVISRTTLAPATNITVGGWQYSGYGWPNGGTGNEWASGGGGGGYYGGATNWPNGGGGSNYIYTASWGPGTITTNSNTVHTTHETGKLIVTIL